MLFKHFLAIGNSVCLRLKTIGVKFDQSDYSI